MDDSHLIERSVQGDQGAFNTLVWRWQDRLYHFALRYIGDAEEARDLCQQAFLRAYSKLGTLRQKEHFGTWLHQIALNICRDHLRRRRPQQSLEQYAEERGQPHPALGTSPPAGQGCELRQLLNRALQTLPEEQRLVIVLKEYQGMKFVEIAAVLDAPVNTVKSRLYYGLKALRRCLQEWDIENEL